MTWLILPDRRPVENASQHEEDASAAIITAEIARVISLDCGSVVDVMVKRYYFYYEATSRMGRLNSYSVLAPPVEFVPELSVDSRTSSIL